MDRIPCDKSKELAIKYGVYEQLSPLIDFDLAATGAENGEEAYLTKEQALVARKNITADNHAQVEVATCASSGKQFANTVYCTVARCISFCQREPPRTSQEGKDNSRSSSRCTCPQQHIAISHA